MGPVLELRDVWKDYPGHRALEQIDLEVPRGGFFSLLGPSGCGKTTALRLIAGFEQPTRGDLYLNGARINHLRPYERNVSLVFQHYALFPHLTVRENVAFGLRRRGVREPEPRVRAMLGLIELAGKEGRYPAELSGGERQRVALARSLVLEPEVLLLDEPLAALDPKLRRQVRGELKALQRRVGIAFLFVTHDQEEAMSLSDQVAVMRAGRLEQVGTPEELYLRPRTRFVAGFLGALNWIDGAGLRPEATRLAPRAPEGDVKSRPATVTNCVFLGSSFQVEARLATGETVTAEVSRLEGGFQAGQAVEVWWRPCDELRLPPEP